ncbi:sensor histidine kinase [Paenibacillus humicola]|uniref:sensor histidine kinase n=1 Tax=Paenibacillus humicola TaxID=3110540 RepID=UPI00237C07E1|nr:histidine kinase [Paenibacillus humicola]
MFYSFKNRLIAIFVLLLVFSSGTMSVLLFNQSRSIIRSYIESSALEKMNEYGSFIDMALMQVYDLSSIVFNSDITKSWNNAMADPTLSEGEKMLANISLSQFLTKATNSYSSVSSVSIYRQDGLRVGADNQVTHDPSFLHSDWYRNFKLNGVQWVSAHIDPFEEGGLKPYRVVSLLLPIGTFEPTMSKSVMKVNVKSDFLLDPLKGIHLGESGTIFLLDQNGRPILSQDEYNSHADAIAEVERIRENNPLQGVVYMKGKNGKVDVLVYKKLERYDWLLVGFVPEGELYAKLYKLRTSIIVFTALLLIAAILIATWLSFGITKPLSRLASAMRSIQKGDFDMAESRIPPKRAVRNEVGFVTETFRNMVSRLREHIKNEFELRLLRQQAEYKALLMQINPHFLFNTLELLTSLAMQRRTRDTVHVIESLGKMMRFSLKASRDLIPLAEELNYLDHYVSILRIRFRDRLEIVTEREGGLDRLEVIKFILQPLVENAVKYSFRHGERAAVQIRIRRAGGQVEMSVADNGPGIPPETVQRLMAESAAVQLDHVLNNETSQIGLRNVLIRCRLYYGSLFSFTIERSELGGTKITLILPVQEGSRDVPDLNRG